METEVVYYSKYASTREIANGIGKRLGTDKIRDVREPGEITGDLVIVGSGIYYEQPGKEILRLLRDEEGRLKDREVALFVVCVAKETAFVRGVEVGGPLYLRRMEEALGRAPLAGKIFGGRMILSELEEKERIIIESFHKRYDMPYQDVDIVSDNEVDDFVREIKDALKL